MATESWPKSGKTGGRPGTAAEPKSQTLGSPYFNRHTLFGDAGTRTREMANDYGKKPQKTGKNDNGLSVNPRRTIITGASPKEPVDPKLPY
jgi:hypothetical protein